MALQIADAIGDGARRAFTYSGGVLMLLMFGYQLLFMGATNTITASLLPAARGAADPGFTLPISVGAAAALAVAGLVAGTVLFIISARALTRPQSELGALPSELFIRRVGRATLSALGANLVVVVAVVVGFIFLVVPGVFLTLSFLFVVFAIGIEDERAVDAMRRSWALASGDRWPLLAVLVVVTVVTSVGSGLGGALSTVSPVVGQIASIALSSVLTVVGYGILADAYLQLCEEKPSDLDPDRTAGAGAREGDPLA
ncbi:hypothetical protein BRC88_13185 [Halobacteriales archaeon QS_4_69_225]|nr:MAG: hypothetical protein BRC88_13185 [Halobacteriales archaeon QS_4_69_225]